MTGISGETPKIDRSRRKARAPKAWVAKPRVGDKLGSFRLLELLGEGGAGAVFRAEHTFLKRPVAIKVLHPELYLDSGMVARFFQEALAVNRARHRNLIDITDVVATESVPPFIVMELLEGLDLGDYIEARAPVPLSWVHRIMKQICAALSVVHDLGIVHRDLKPENIFLMETGEDVPTVKLLDFGIAKFLDSEDNRRRTWSGNILGTPAYMPLEQIRGLPVDHRADIYALGVVAYETLTGRLPFDMDSVEDLLESLSVLVPPPPSTRTILPVSEPIPPAVDALVLRCLAVDPKERFQSVAELAAAFDEAMEGSAAAPVDVATGAAAVLTTPAAAAPEAAPSTAGTEPKRGAWAVAMAALLVVGASLGGWFLFRDREEPAPAVGAPAAGTPAGGARGEAVRRIRLTSFPPRADILDGETRAVVGKTPQDIRVLRGTPRRLTLRLPGYRESPVTVRFGDPSPVRVALVESPMAAALAAPSPMARPTDRAIRRGPWRGGMRPTPRVAPRPMQRVTEQGIVDPFRK